MQTTSEALDIPQPPKVDPYSRDENGRITSYCGFSVPMDFPEFYERFPDYVDNRVRSLLQTRGAIDLKDAVSDMLAYLMSVPPESIYRKPGYNNRPGGCTDRIQLFDPEKSFGATPARFFHWLSRCIHLQIKTLATRLTREPVYLSYQHGTFERSEIRSGTMDYGQRTDSGRMEYIQQERLGLGSSRPPENERDRETSLFISQFKKYVRGRQPGLVRIIEALEKCENLAQVQREVKMTKTDFRHAMERLTNLGGCFTKQKAIRGKVEIPWMM